jgi:chromosome segregation ATPase
MGDRATSEDFQSQREPSSYRGFAIAAGALALACFAGFQYAETRNLRAEMAASQSEIQALRQSLNTQSGVVETKLAQVLKRLEAAKEEASSDALSRAQLAAERQNKALAARLERQQRATAAAVEAELKRLQAESEQTVAGVKSAVEDVKTEVAGVRTGLTGAQGSIQRTDLELTRVRGDLGVMSGLIATNAKEIAALRELGDRSIYEFTLAKSSQLERVGDIRVKVKKTDAKRNRYTMEILADDKLVEKKDRTINEPVQFYVPSRARMPYEIVVNEVNNGSITGYLAAPKLRTAQN